MSGRWLLLAAAVAVGRPARADPTTPGPGYHPDPEHTRAAVARILAGREYRFCQDAKTRLVQDDLSPCVYADAASDLCPELGAVCARAEQERRDLAARPSAPSGGWLRGLAVLSAFARLLLYALLGAVVAGLLFAVARGFSHLRRRERRTGPAASASAAVAGAVTVPSGTAAELLRRARAAADRGELAPATRHAYLGLLRLLQERGALELHPSRTHGDYVRALRSDREAHDALRAATSVVDRLEFGGTPATRELFERVWAAVRSLARGVVPAVLLAAGLLAGCEGVRRIYTEVGDHGPAGFSLFRDVVLEQGMPVRRRIQRIASIGADVQTIVVLSPLTEAEWVAIFGWLGQGKQLVVASDSSEAAERIGASPVVSPAEKTCDVDVTVGGTATSHDDEAKDGDATDADEERVVTAPAPAARRATGAAAAAASDPTGRHAQSAAPPETDEDDGEDDDGGSHDPDVDDPSDGGPSEATLVAATGRSLKLTHDGFTSVKGCDGQPYFAWRDLPEGGTIVVTAGWLPLSNAALAAGDNALIALYLLAPLTGPVELVGSWTGSGAASPLESISKGRLGPAVAQLLVLVLAIILWRWPFGSPRPERPVGRRSFVEHVRALGRQYARARASRHALAAYAAWALERLRSRLQVAEGASPRVLARALVARTGGDAAWAEVVLESAHAAIAAGGGRGGSPDDLATLRELSRLTHQLGGTE